MLGRGNGNLHLASLEFFSSMVAVPNRIRHRRSSFHSLLGSGEALNVDGCTNLILFTYPQPELHGPIDRVVGL